jgi:hypothetical protein
MVIWKKEGGLWYRDGMIFEVDGKQQTRKWINLQSTYTGYVQLPRAATSVFGITYNSNITTLCR